MDDRSSTNCKKSKGPPGVGRRYDTGTVTVRESHCKGQVMICFIASFPVAGIKTQFHVHRFIVEIRQFPALLLSQDPCRNPSHSTTLHVKIEAQVGFNFRVL